jgi:hypothetical protein
MIPSAGKHAALIGSRAQLSSSLIVGFGAEPIALARASHAGAFSSSSSNLYRQKARMMLVEVLSQPQHAVPNWETDAMQQASFNQ